MSEAPPASEAAQPDPASKKPTAIELAADTLGHDLLQAMVQECEQTVTWKGYTEIQIQTAINRLRDRVQKLVKEALGILLRGDYPAVKGVLESITVKDGIKATLKISRTEHHLAELADFVGSPVVLVMHDPAAYMDRIESIRAQRDQRELFDEQGHLKVAEEPKPTGDGEQSADADTSTLPAEGGEPDKAPPPWKQAQAALERINVLVSDDEAKAWTTGQCTEAVFWVQIIEGIPKTAPPAPAHVKIPTGWKRPRKRSS
jgi:hypothetical protein